jgi:hypothetical protein
VGLFSGVTYRRPSGNGTDTVSIGNGLGDAGESTSSVGEYWRAIEGNDNGGSCRGVWFPGPKPWSGLDLGGIAFEAGFVDDFRLSMAVIGDGKDLTGVLTRWLVMDVVGCCLAGCGVG